MIKKEVLIVLAIFLLFIMPQTYAFECLTYEDCEKSQCIGTNRMCIEGSCINSECLLKSGNAFIDKKDNNSGIASIISLSTKILFLAIISLMIALLFPMLRLHRKVKIIIGICFGIFTIIFGLYLFDGVELINKIFGYNMDEWDYDKADREILALINNENYEVDETLISSKEIIGGKEYKLKNLRYENSLIILKFNSNSSFLEIEMINDYTAQKTLYNNKINLNDYNIYNTYYWNSNNLSFILTGEKDESDKIIKYLLLNRTIQTPKINIDKKIKITNPPLIKIIKPNLHTYTSDNEIIFQITDNDSLIDKDSIGVSGILGFSKIDCVDVNNQINCSFYGELKNGINTMNIYVKDIYENKAFNNYQILFDDISWEFSSIYPTNESYNNLARIHFKLWDEHSGLNQNTFTIKGINISLELCNKNKKEIECEIDNLMISEGKHTIEIFGKDNANNLNSIKMNYYYDKTRPNIEVTQRGFIVSDNIKLKNDSLFLDNKRYSFDNCKYIYHEYHCEYSQWVKEFSVMDEAGNSFYLESKKIR